MKYGNTSRTLSLILHGLVFVLFASLALYFGAFVAPVYFLDQSRWGSVLPYNLVLELAVIGTALATMSGFGLFYSYKSLVNAGDDKPVVAAFTCFIVEGYIGAIFCLLNAAIYSDLTTTSSIPFIVILGIILAIALLIAANIPMVKLFDGKDSTMLFFGMSIGAAVSTGSIGFFSLLSLLVSFGKGIDSWLYEKRLILLIYVIANLIAAGLAIAGAVIVKKNSAGQKSSNIAALLDCVGISVFGLGLVLIGTADLVYKDGLVHFESAKFAFTGMAYPLCSIIFGSLIVIGGLIAAGITYSSSQKKAISK